VGTVFLVSSQVPGFVPPRGRGSSWSARSVSARQGAGEEAPARIRACRAGGLLAAVRSRARAGRAVAAASEPGKVP
jgi:hypothetical protein